MGDVKLRAGLDGLAAARALRFEMRMRGQGPAVGDTAKAKLRDTLRRRRAEESAWDHDKPRDLDHGDFQRDALPVTQGVPVRHLAARTGLWMGYCALIRRPLRTPNPRSWEVLRKGPLPPLSAGASRQTGIGRLLQAAPAHPELRRRARPRGRFGTVLKLLRRR